MFTNCFIDGRPVIIIMSRNNEQRLMTTCFRGRGRRLAGNFFDWGSASELFNDNRVSSLIVGEVENAIHNRTYNLLATLDMKQFVGWSSTDDLGRYDPRDLSPFKINGRATGLMVGDLFTAPRTNHLAVSLSIKFNYNPHEVVVIIHTVYPGRNIGRLIDDVSRRERVVFFPWDRVGEK